MSKVDSTILDLEESAQDLEVFTDEFAFDPQSPKLAGAVFGSARQRALSKSLKDPSRRDSPTLPWQSPKAKARASKLDAALAKEPQATPRVQRPDSPDIQTILARTPRPRKSSSSLLTASSLSSQSSLKKTPKTPVDDESLISDFGALLELDSDFEDGGSASDSSLDIHTPLPHLMFRDGLLSPRSKLLPQSISESSNSPYSQNSEDIRAGSVLSLASTAGSVMTGLQKDPRDTHRRRLRHRDGRLLRAGMGLTTGLGWSDSEDEDAPSPLTRRLIHTTIDRQRSGSQSSVSRPTSQCNNPSMSRFASPTPSNLGLSRKDASYSSLRSASVASVSFPSKISGPGTGLRVPRGRAASATSAASSTFSDLPSVLATPPLGMARIPILHEQSSTSSFVLTRRTLTESPAIDVSPKTPTAKLSSVFPTRPRAESVTSNSSTSTSLSHSMSYSHIPGAPSSAAHRIPRPRTGSNASVPRGTSKATRPNGPQRPRADSNVSTSNTPSNPSVPRIPRPRTESTTSTSTSTTTSHASHTSAASQSSQNSSSTASSGSTVPRPLRLPQSAALKPPTRSFSQDPTSNLPPSGLSFPRSRTLSNPHSSIRLPISPTQPKVLTTSNSLSSGVLPPGSPPTLRQRHMPNGARPQPRTGTGMAYRTSSSYSYASFHESGTKMRGLSLLNYSQNGVAI